MMSFSVSAISLHFIISWSWFFCIHKSTIFVSSFTQTSTIQNAPSIILKHRSHYFSCGDQERWKTLPTVSLSSHSCRNLHKEFWGRRRSISTRLYESFDQQTTFDTSLDSVASASSSPVSVSIFQNGHVNGVKYVNGSANGVNGSHNGVTSNSNVNGSRVINGDAAKTPVSVSISMQTKPQSLVDMENDPEDIPLPTENGGFTHTRASRAKIAAANKGKTPWNKGRERTPEERARIAAGVRAKNRERFLKKLENMGVTEEEYEEKKKAERRKRDAERRARKTAKGGFRPTEETKAKISEILKEKYAKGEIKRRNVDPSKVRRGFTHTEETRAKISESLRKRWSNDPDYRQKMLESNKIKHTTPETDTKKKISETLKKKWQDPEFREKMLGSMASRKKPSSALSREQREKISIAMKAKWKDKRYREKTMKSISQRAEEARKTRPVKVKKPRVKGAESAVRKIQPLKSGESRAARKALKKSKPLTTKKEASKVSSQQLVSIDDINILDNNSASDETLAQSASVSKPKKTIKKAPVKKKKKKKKKEPDGSVNRLKEERRDLFDLLYGDEPLLADDDDDDLVQYNSKKPVSARFGLEDDDLDSFDPYGLDDY